MPQRLRFTLVEMMIVVAIVSVLAAIAIPALNHSQLVAKRAELPPNIDGLMASVLAYEAANDDFPLPAQAPGGTAGKAPRPWTTGTTFDVMGWRPDGDVRATYYFQYSFIAGGLCGGGSAILCGGDCVAGRIDADADGWGNCWEDGYGLGTNLQQTWVNGDTVY